MNIYIRYSCKSDNSYLNTYISMGNLLMTPLTQDEHLGSDFPCPNSKDGA